MKMADKISFENALSIAIGQYKCKQLDTIPDLQQLASEFVPSSDFIEKAEKIIRNAESRHKKSGLDNLKKIAVIVVLSFVLLSNSTVATAIKNALPSFIIEWYDKYTAISTVSDIEGFYVIDFVLNYVPDGYYMIDGDKYDKTYVNGDLRFRVSVNLESNYSSYNVDNEYTTFYEIEIDGIKGVKHVHEDGYNGLIMSADGVRYHITGTAAQEEMVKIYQGVEVILGELE